MATHSVASLCCFEGVVTSLLAASRATDVARVAKLRGHLWHQLPKGDERSTDVVLPYRREEPPLRRRSSSFGSDVTLLGHDAPSCEYADSRSADGSDHTVEECLDVPLDVEFRVDSKAPLSSHLCANTNFRGKFLRTLSYRKVWQPACQRDPLHQQVTIFDWDDTLLCTSALQHSRRMEALDAAWTSVYVASQVSVAHRSVVKQTMESLPRLEKLVTRLIEMALARGRVFIITNAAQGWVETSCAEFFPSLCRGAMQRVEVISARAEHEHAHPGDVMKWKLEAFRKVRSALRGDLITNLLSIGDSPSEMEAAHVLATEFEDARVKTVKLCEQPTATELCKELELVESSFASISTAAGNLSVSLLPTEKSGDLK